MGGKKKSHTLNLQEMYLKSENDIIYTIFYLSQPSTAIMALSL